MRYTIYRVTNVESGKFYIGKHQTLDPQDQYLGSGRAIRAAIKKYGRTSFIKEVLFDFDTEEEMNAKERDLITEDLVIDSACYNMSVGGEGGPHFKNRSHSEATREILRKKRREYRASEETREKLRNRRHTDETKKKIAELRNGVAHSSETKNKISKSMTGRTVSEETKRKISETMKNRRTVDAG